MDYAAVVVLEILYMIAFLALASAGLEAGLPGAVVPPGWRWCSG